MFSLNFCTFGDKSRLNFLHSFLNLDSVHNGEDGLSVVGFKSFTSGAALSTLGLGSGGLSSKEFCIPDSALFSLLSFASVTSFKFSGLVCAWLRSVDSGSDFSFSFSTLSPGSWSKPLFVILFESFSWDPSAVFFTASFFSSNSGSGSL